MFAGQKPKAEAVPGSPVVESPVGAAKVVAPDAKPIKKIDMPREVFVEWIDGDDAGVEKPVEGEDARAPSGAAQSPDLKGKRAAPQPKDIDQILEEELQKSGSKKRDTSDDEEHRFIEVN